MADVKLHDLTVVAGAEGLLHANGLDSLAALFDIADTDRLDKPGLSAWRERLRLTLSVDGAERLFYLKRFHNPPPRARRELRRSGSGASSLAGMEWTWMHRLAAGGVACVRPVAFGEQIENGKELRSAILMEAVPGESLERWVIRWSNSDRSMVRVLIHPLAELVARLHTNGYVHRDLYLSHVFYDSGLPPHASLHLIDLQRVTHPRWPRRRWIVKDLASLNYSAPAGLVSKADRFRWLTRYLSLTKLDISARRLTFLIVGKTRRIAGHDRRRALRWRVRS